MRSKDILDYRNRKMFERFFELKESYKNTHVILRILSKEFYLSEKTITNIVFSKKQREKYGFHKNLL